ncbi:MAG: hypothetical protein O3A80_02230 [bacterium]|nr:hypothetical protein [bacterium]MDA1292873.1 hypothetical protein [bacterium]
MAKKRITIPDGETAFLNEDGEFQLGGSNEYYGEPYAKAGTVIVGRDVDRVESSCGPCRIIALINEDTKLGALIHVDVAFKNHEELLGKLIEHAPDIIKPDTRAVIVGEDDTDEDEEKNHIPLQNWQQEIRTYLLSLGITNIIDVTPKIADNEFLNIELDTRNAVIRVVNNDAKPIYIEEKE